MLAGMPGKKTDRYIPNDADPDARYSDVRAAIPNWYRGC